MIAPGRGPALIVKPIRKWAHWIREALAPEQSDRLDSAAFCLFLILAVSAPWMYFGLARIAGSSAGAMRLGNLLVELFAFLVAAGAFQSRSSSPQLRPLALPLAAAGGIALLGMMQLLALPDRILEIVVPVNKTIYSNAARILSARISIAPTETVKTLLLLLAYGALFFSGAKLLRTRLRRSLFAGALVVTAIAQIFFGVFRESLDDRTRGVFANPDHFAGYLEIALALVFGALWAEALASATHVGRTDHPPDRVERRFVPVAVWTLIWSGVLLGIVLTRSRGGILAATLTTLILLVMALLHRGVASRQQAVASAAPFLLAGFILAAMVAGAAPFERFLKRDLRDLGGNARVLIWRASLQAWKDSPIVGSGLGTFREAFQPVRPPGMPWRIEHAHSDFLELLVTGGVVGAALGMLLFVSFFVLLFQRWRDEKRREESAFVLAGLGALLSLTLHGLVEFNLSIPPIPATLACVLGAAWAAGEGQ
jgi:O-antigen ligase